MGYKARQTPASIDALLSGNDKRDVAFRPQAAAVTEEDLVAFANAEQGGTLLVGAEEPRARRGRRAPAPTIVGCAASAAEQRVVRQAGQRCVPPVAVSITVCAHEDKKLLRVDVAPSTKRPHCTAGGTYTIRDGGRTVPLTPDKLGGLVKPAAAPAPRPAAARSAKPAPSQASTDALINDLSVHLTRELAELSTGVGINIEALKRTQDRVFQALAQRLDENRRVLAANRKLMRALAGQAAVKSKREPDRPRVVLVQLKRDEDDEATVADVPVE